MLNKILAALFLALCFHLSVFSKTVKLSDFKPNRNDATTAFKNAINSGASRIIVDNPGFVLQINAIRLRSNLELSIEDGVIIEAQKNSFKSLGAFLFTAVNCKNITIRGKGMVILRMRKNDYQNKKLYKHSEWRHLFGLKGCQQIKIHNLTLASSGGDGIYLGTTTKNPYCKDVILEKLIIKDHHRQGISVISAENLTIRQCKIINTAGTPPAAGIDFEPNSRPEGQRLVNCLVENCIISGNEGGGIVLYTVYMENGCPPQSITVRNCLIEANHEAGISITNSFYRKGRQNIAPPTGFYKFENCRIINNTGSAVVINDYLPTVKLSFDNCLIVPGKSSRSYPVLLSAHHMKEAAVGGIEFKNVTIAELPAGRNVLVFKSWHSSSLANISGDIFIKTKEGKERFPLKSHIAKINKAVKHRNKSKFKPVVVNWKKFSRSEDGVSKVENSVSAVQTRDRFAYIVWAKAGEKVNITAKRKVQNPFRKVKLELKSSTGKELYKSELNQKNKIAKINFTAPTTGCYILSGASGGEGITITCGKPGGWYSYKRPFMFAGKHNKLFFAVPQGVKSFELKVAGYLNHPYVKATVRNQQGKVIASNNSIEEPFCFKISRNDCKREIWSLDIETANAKEFALVQQGKSLEGIFAASPERVLQLKK
jgi:hypothetical protein